MKTFQKILIANRGEIAMRVIRACHELDIQAVAVFSEVDKDSLHVKFADEAVCIGPPSAKDSYLNAHAILSAAEVTGADAIHPGYGFLSENSEFAELVERCGLVFIGPTPANMEQLGDKLKAKELARQAGVPLLESVPVKGLSDSDLHSAAESIGYPILTKAAKGGGGRGMKLIETPAALLDMVSLAKAESLSSFGSDDVYLEKFCASPRHIEFQIAADQEGKVVYFPERECSIQRRHQKLIEESPSVVVDDALRCRMGEVSVALAKSVGYRSMGTVEFLLDAKKEFFFLEMNTRIQVEHPVTEMVSGIDLLKEQIKIAAGNRLSFSQSQIQPRGHAIECRVTAEHPETFQPSPGAITHYHVPCGYGVRVESVACASCGISPYYDSMIAKLITHADDRPQAIRKMSQALSEYIIGGISSNIPFHQKVMKNPRFLAGETDTGFIAREFGIG